MAAKLTGFQKAFQDEVMLVIERHFAPPIAKNFFTVFETQIFNNESENIWAQKKREQYVLELRYRTKRETSEYICDLYSTWGPKYMEYHILRYITDKVKAGKIGADWSAAVSNDVSSGKHETRGGN